MINIIKKKRLLFLIDSIATGGAQKRLIDLINNLDKSRYECSVCAFYEGTLLREYKKNKIRTTILNPRKMGGILSINKLFLVIKFLKDKKFDAVLTLLPDSISYGVIAAKLRDIPLIIACREIINPDIYLKRKRLLLLRISNLFVDKIIAVSKAIRNNAIKYEKLDPDKIIAIHNGIDVKRFNKKVDVFKKKRELNLLGNENIVEIIARLYPQKNHKNFLKAARLVIKQIPNTKFLIIGDGPLRKELEDYSKSIGLSKNVIFTGPRSDILELLGIGDISVLSSNREGLPIVILESMATCKPVVATNIKGIAEVVANGKTGILVPPKKPEALANAIIKLLKNPKLKEKMGKAGRKRVEKYFTMERIVKEYEKVMIN